MAVTAGVSAPRSVMINGQNVALSAQDQVSTSGNVTTVVAKSDDGGGVGGFIGDYFSHFFGGIGRAGGNLLQGGVKLAAGDSGGAVKQLGSKNNIVTDAAGGIGNMLHALTDPLFWERIGIGALGFFLILIGVVFMIESNKTARSLTEMAVAV